MRALVTTPSVSRVFAAIFSFLWVGMFSVAWIAIKPRIWWTMSIGINWIFPFGLIYYAVVYVVIVTTVMWIGLGLFSFVAHGGLKVGRGLWVIPVAVILTLYGWGLVVYRPPHSILAASFLLWLPLVPAFLISAWNNFSD
jgi:hypothetical protein